MSESGEGPLGPDELIGKLVPDSSNPGVCRLVGFGLGESDRSAYWRLYINGDLTEYLEFRKDDCLNGKERRDGYTIVWLKRDARITHIRSEKAALEFVRGPVRQFLRPTGFAAMASGAGLGTGGMATSGPQCCCLTIPIGRGFYTTDLCGPV